MGRGIEWHGFSCTAHFSSWPQPVKFVSPVIKASPELMPLILSNVKLLRTVGSVWLRFVQLTHGALGSPGQFGTSEQNPLRSLFNSQRRVLISCLAPFDPSETISKPFKTWLIPLALSPLSVGFVHLELSSTTLPNFIPIRRDSEETSKLIATMDSRPFEEYPMMPTVTTYLSPNTYQSSSGQYHGSSPGPSSYSYPSSPQSASSVPGNFTLFSCSERALAKEVSNRAVHREGVANGRN